MTSARTPRPWRCSDDWDASLERLRALAAAPPGEGVPLGELRPLPPVAPAGQVLCGGANYSKHLRQMAYAHLKREGDPRPEEELRAAADEISARRAREDPFVFAGLPSALCGAEDDVILWGPGHEHDWELELAVVLGRGGRSIPASEALQCVAGYTICNDVSTRDVMFRPGFPMTDFLMTKMRPTFFPTGPYVVPREFVPDYRAAAHHARGKRRGHAGRGRRRHHPWRRGARRLRVARRRAAARRPPAHRLARRQRRAPRQALARPRRRHGGLDHRPRRAAQPLRPTEVAWP